jgi:hypothetical protein
MVHSENGTHVVPVRSVPICTVMQISPGIAGGAASLPIVSRRRGRGESMSTKREEFPKPRLREKYLEIGERILALLNAGSEGWPEANKRRTLALSYQHL